MAQDFNYQTTAVAEQRGGIDHDSGAATAATMASTPHSELKRFRISKRESQEKFWGRFGVTQSSGSRFETGLGIPAPVAILVKLYVKGKLSDGDLPG
ncbi:helix-turn-helix domain-containing protein [Massilia genomosp. 1]|nr:helix-turn-helix transcriptional regulator [Massilia genomosp. 1]